MLCKSMIRFSLFGNYERFSTNNLDTYMKLIDFLVERDINQLQQMNYSYNQMVNLECLSCPFFLNDMGVIVEITSNRINFQKMSIILLELKC